MKTFSEFITEAKKPSEAQIEKDKIECGKMFITIQKEMKKDKEDLGKGVTLSDVYSEFMSMKTPTFGKEFKQVEDYYTITSKDEGIIEKFKLEMSDMKSIKAKVVTKVNDIAKKVQGKMGVNIAYGDGTVNRIDFGLNKTGWNDKFGYGLDLHITYTFKFPKTWDIKEWKNA